VMAIRFLAVARRSHNISYIVSRTRIGNCIIRTAWRIFVAEIGVAESDHLTNGRTDGQEFLWNLGREALLRSTQFKFGFSFYFVLGDQA
jgi:hypothetical protein